MVTLQSLLDSFLPSPASPLQPPDVEAVRERCYALLTDVPASERKALLQRLDRLRRADDLWHWRGAFFDLIARQHGETVAQTRLALLDERLR